MQQLVPYLMEVYFWMILTTDVDQAVAAELAS
jgi:hypothetical protein